MFSLIISIISIALVVILAGASLFYGGDALEEGGIKGQVAQYQNEAQQLSAGLLLYLQENHSFEDDFTWDRLVETDILKSVPSSAVDTDGASAIFAWGVKDNLIILPGISDAVCLKANEMEGVETEFDSAPVDYMQLGGVDSNTYVPVCGPTVDDTVPCCYDNSAS